MKIFNTYYCLDNILKYLTCLFLYKNNTHCKIEFCWYFIRFFKNYVSFYCSETNKYGMVSKLKEEKQQIPIKMGVLNI